MQLLAVQLALLVGYILAGRLVIKYLQGWPRELVFTALNLAALYFSFFVTRMAETLRALWLIWEWWFSST